MPSNTPGTRNGSQSANPTGKRQPTKPTTMQSVAPAAANETEFQMAACPAASAPGSSDQVRVVEINWMIGSPTDKTAISTVTIPQNWDQPAPSCCRNNRAATGPSTRGHATALRRNQISSSNGIRIIGQLDCSAAAESNVVLKFTHISAG